MKSSQGLARVTIGSVLGPRATSIGRTRCVGADELMTRAAARALQNPEILAP
jgi:hypothetical protein